jgi:F-type H+-transporting ATPase subunit delta
MGILIFLLDVYKDRANKLKGIVKAEVESAIPLSSKKIGHLMKRLEEIFKKKIEVETKVIPSIIGGIKVTVGSKVIDITIVNRLKRLKERLLMA